uniref:Dynein heavy chain hydrolytic ATP-binding dynein motor region domain-containing protein n=1 Tax=Globisporangium ultimum (strain ATCC 200006 / CBS 805.95 / DAOM BR144) TaxID=431595 RepID=K3WA65_GLOUD
MSNVEKQLANLEEVVKKHFYYEKTLGLPQTTAFDAMEDVKLDLTLKTDLWKALNSWNGAVVQWEKLTFTKEVDVIAIAENIQDYYAQITSWEKNLSSGMHLLCAHLKSKIEEYRLTMPILTYLRCPCFEERHFTELQTLLGFSIRDQDRSTETALTLSALVKMQLAPFGPQINRIATEATQERILKEMLDKIIGMWEHMEFEVKPYKGAKDSYVLVSYENIYASLEESLVSMTAILSSKYLTPIKDIATTWQKRLAIFQETLDVWVECQRKWMHLESIFAAPDIQKQLPNEGILFVAVNQFWKDLMRRARDQKNCLKVSGALFVGFGNNSSATVSAGAGHAVLDTMLKHNVSLERIEKSLEDYLETKRGFFPRFYFISNDELLEILAHAKEPQAVQRHLCKCFDALVKLELSEDSNHAIGSGGRGGSNYYDIVAMISPEGERVSFGRVLKARGNVEDWLNAVLTTMKATLHRHIKSCLLDYQHASRENWLFRHPAQAVAVVSYIIWARECETCFRSASHDPIRELKLWHQTICTQLSNLTRLVRTSLSPLQRSTVVSLITTDVHFRDVVEDLIEKRVTSVDNFVWVQQLRYNWQPEHDACDVMQANCRILYGYEYMGACNRLVITPLTDRCWMTITGALDLRFGAAPSGPAGTGKTETSKDLAKALGILCIVFNCSDQIDYKMMGKIFNGVIQAGSWACLDEFNRIDIEVLSVVAQQMHVLRHARLMNSHDVFFEGKQVALRDHHVIITMNPGYVGRTELPDNLKVCFRPVAMMVPDYAQIAEILLFAEGFQTAKILSRKVTKLFKLCSEQLSQQPHYDFGMRSVKSVLTMAGTLKRMVTAASSLANHLDENLLLIRAMYDANIPKFIDEDIPLFRGILRDLFPETLSSSFQGDGGLLHAATAGVSSWIASLDEEVDHQLVLHGLQIAPKWKTKIIELFTTLNVRIGVVQTGASGSGKSTAMRVLKESLTTLRDVKAHPSEKFQRVVSFVLNPKSISMCELYGFFHPITREWIDGLASSILRACITEKSEQLMHSQPKSNENHSGSASDGGPYYWITFDGPIDVLWIESMNTVLDDNMTLCLANGERIKLLPRIHLLFEVLDTALASPATISRLGVVYYHPGNLGWQPYVETWAATLAVPLFEGVK